jgi:hypothetical protein
MSVDVSWTDAIQWFAIFWLLLKALDTSIRLRRLERGAAQVGRSGEADETPLGGSAVGEHAVGA